MTNQEIFDKVAKHLLTQNARSQDIRNIVCAYRGSNDMKCAIGVLIEDKYYNRLLEGYSVSDFNVKKALEKSGIEFDNGRIYFLHDLQRIHDSALIGSWRDRLEELAHKYKLNAAILDSIGATP